MPARDLGQTPVFYINLASRADRRLFMEEQFERLGIDAERIEAVRAADVEDAAMVPHLDNDNPWALSRVEVACGLSHAMAWQRLLDEGHPSALILEDDVVLGDALPAFLVPSATAALGADLIKLETFNEQIRVGRTAALIAGRFAVRTLLASHMGAGAYIISADMARRALADPAFRQMSVDRYLFCRGGPIVPSASVYQVDPAPTVQLHKHTGDKDNGGHRQVSAGNSDLLLDRRTHRAGIRHTWRYKLRTVVAGTLYTLRLLAHALPDAEARRERRRRITFDPGA